jgi:hypothetical protein
LPHSLHSKNQQKQQIILKNQQKQQIILKNSYKAPEGLPPGGRLQHFYQKWQSITNHQWPLSIIQQGYQIQFTAPPTPWKPPRPLKFSAAEQQAVNLSVEKILQAGVIEIAPDQNEKNYLSQLFTVQEPNKIRPILDCRKINSFVQCHHFKMEGIPALRDMIQPMDYITKIDLKDAYTVVPIHPNSRKYLSFQHQGKIYSYRSLAFGLNVAPRIYSKLMRYALEPLRRVGVRLCYYLDDICCLATSKKESEEATATILDHLQQLGFIINWDKSQIKPSTCQEFLGFTFNTKTMQIQVPHKKMSKLFTRIKQLKKAHQQKSWKSCRWIAALIGKMTAMLPAIGEALIHLRYLQRDLAVNLRYHRQNWDSTCPISESAMNELDWWINIAESKNGLSIHQPTPPPPAVEIYVDASNTGWGISSALMETSGFWTVEEQNDHINIKELKTILFAIKLHGPKFVDSAIAIFTDNTTALKYARKSGGTASPLLQQLALEINYYTTKYNLAIIYNHIAGIKNTQADLLSRLVKPIYEWTLPWKHFNKIQAQWGPLSIDAFASRVNARLPRYWSYLEDPDAQAVNAFSQAWPKTGLYLHPPWKLIPKVLRKLQLEQVKEAVLVTPLWPTQFWWPMILQMTHKKFQPIVLPLNHKFQLIAWKLSPITTVKKKAYHHLK